MAEVVLSSVGKKYGAVTAVTNLNLECKDGEFLVLLGPSGAGKTSILKMISGLETVTSGEIAIGGRVVNSLEPRQRRVAMVFENYALFPHLSVFENLASPLRAAKLPAVEIERKVRSVGDMLKIAHLVDRRPSQLSGGQQQRVSFGRALVKEAQVYLMDEPLSHLDAKLRHQMRGELKRIHADIGVTTIYVTHDFSEALALADRIAVVHRGVIQQIGTPDEIYDHPANEFVADLVGEPPMNLLECGVSRTDGQFRFWGEGFAIPVPSTLESRLSALEQSQRLSVGIRPTQILAQTGSPRPGAIRAEVYVLEPLGGISILTARVGKSLLKVRVGETFAAEIGDPVYLTLDQEKLRVFDRATGASLA